MSKKFSIWTINPEQSNKQTILVNTYFTQSTVNLRNSFKNIRKDYCSIAQLQHTKLMKLEFIHMQIRLHNYPYAIRRRNTSRSEHCPNKGVTSGRSYLSIHFSLLKADEGVKNMIYVHVLVLKCCSLYVSFIEGVYLFRTFLIEPINDPY